MNPQVRGQDPNVLPFSSFPMLEEIILFHICRLHIDVRVMSQISILLFLDGMV